MTFDQGTRPENPVRLERYAVVVFDCDGVLLDSNNLKTNVFRKVLAEHGFPDDEIEAFTAYQVKNFGTSRYHLLQAVVDGVFGERRSVTLAALLTAFGTGCKAGYSSQPETPGLSEALARAGADGRALYVASGSDEQELRAVFEERGLATSFAAIYGSPTVKTENLRRVRAHRAGLGAYRDEPILFIGDAEADMCAAVEAGVDFLYMAAFSTVRASLEPRVRTCGWPVIEDLRDLL